MTTRTQAPDIPGHRHVRLVSAAGGYGDVHLYEEAALGRQVAVKVIREADLSPVTVQRFLAEAGAMAALEHPNIVRVNGAGQTSDGRPYISMQYCSAETLEQKAGRQRLDVAEVLRACIGIGSAIETAHRAGLLHRDVKPANILTTPWGAPGLTDFGVAARISAAEAAPEQDVGVSVPWSAPEMLFTDTSGSPAVDVYSLAATFWHLLVGRPPFAMPSGDNSRMAMMGRIRDLPVPPTGRPDVPESLERLLRQAMAKQPHQRPQTMADLVQALQAIERELRLPVTEAVFVDVAVSRGDPDRAQPTSEQWLVPSLDRATGDGPATRLRPRTAGPQPDAFLSGPPSGGAEPSGDERTRHRVRTAAPQQGSPFLASPRAAGPGEQSTQLRPRITEHAVPAGPDPAPSAATRRTLLGAGALAVVLAAAGGYWLVGRGGGDAVPRPSVAGATVGADGAAAEDAVPPGPVTVTAARRGDRVTFSWRYSAALSSDTFRWQLVGGRSGVAKQARLTVPARGGTPVCLQVIVVRADGSFASTQWSAKGCSG